MNCRTYIKLSLLFLILGYTTVEAQLQSVDMLNVPVDISKDFTSFENTYYLADKLGKFDPVTATGEIIYNRYEYSTRVAFDNMLAVLKPVAANEFPTTEYAASPALPFQIQFLSARTVRLKATSGFQTRPERESLMLINGKVTVNQSEWKYKKIEGGHQYTSEFGSVTLMESPFHVEFRDQTGRLLTRTIHHSDHAESTFTPVLPFSYVRRASDYSRSMSAVFSSEPDEKIYGCGESFTQLNKRGQKVVLWADDANGVQNETM
jgi:alpha-D-xyloside xylohydrolase